MVTRISLGSSVLYPDRSSLGGWQVHLREAIRPASMPRTSRASRPGDHEAVVRGGARGAGGCRLCAVGPARIDGCGRQALVVCGAGGGAARHAGLPYLHSTRLYPEWPFASVAGVPDNARPAGCGGAAVDARASRLRERRTAQLDFARNYQSILNSSAPPTRPVFARAYRLAAGRHQYDLQISIFIAAVIAMLTAALLLIRRSNRAFAHRARPPPRHRRAALGAREARFLSLFGENVLGIIYQEPNGRIVAANRAAERILDSRARAAKGWTRSTQSGMRCTLMAARWRPKSTPRCGRWPSAGCSAGSAWASTPSQNSTHWLNVSAVPQFRPGETAPFQIFVVFEDITEQVIETRLAARHRLC